jgi:preprotein translocase subunit SecA
VSDQILTSTDYIITTNEHDGLIIAPVDYQNTGVIHPDTSWDNGLHQFLQIKHGLKITPEQFMTCFISNIAYFSRYGTNLYGLTGTIGEKQAQELLKHIYPIDIVWLPTYKLTRFIEIQPLLVETKAQWLEAIATSCLSKQSK